MKSILLAALFLLFFSDESIAQYAPQAGIVGSTAIAGNSPLFVGWATSCNVKRGYLDIAQPALGKASAGDSSLAIGAADNYVVSLGDSGVATLYFSNPITNGPGADFVVFENGFLNPNNTEEAFLELAFVEVSSDGIHFFRFPSNSLTQDTSQISSVVGQNYMNARLMNNLAGKYIANYGTPFDLQELAGITGLDISRITHVRVVDVIGSIGSLGTFDQTGRKINDPYPTPFPTGGFDLDAVGVLHHLWPTSLSSFSHTLASIYPNPTENHITLKCLPKATFRLFDVTGNTIRSGTMDGSVDLDVSFLSSGIYFITFTDQSGNRCTEHFIKH
ncbi:MAG: T9SS type A sorting domain-containing protein [Bacteroidetes bacterium]|nr:T9SS type A sorting domain-containing protein [Bacteroidota bacterium]MBS1741223.1 T9SS type A sorting domain-containing protein [Bacteroidota bacterium]